MELLGTLFLLIIANLLFGKKHKRRQDRDGDNYIILSELDQDHGEHDANTGSIYDGDGDADF